MLADKVINRLSLERTRNVHRQVIAQIDRIKRCPLCDEFDCPSHLEDVDQELLASLEKYKKKLSHRLYELRIITVQ
jgi:hypothetical protein